MHGASVIYYYILCEWVFKFFAITFKQRGFQRNLKIISQISRNCTIQVDSDVNMIYPDSGVDLEGAQAAYAPLFFCRDRECDFVCTPQAERMHQIVRTDFQNYIFFSASEMGISPSVTPVPTGAKVLSVLNLGALSFKRSAPTLSWCMCMSAHIVCTFCVLNVSPFLIIHFSRGLFRQQHSPIMCKMSTWQSMVFVNFCLRVSIYIYICCYLSKPLN